MSEEFHLYGPSTFVQRLALRLLKLLGWRVSSVVPPGPKGVIIVYPHTSNWDFIYGVLFRFGTSMQANWLAKDSMFRGPWGSLFKRIGGLSVDRREPQGFINKLLAEFERRASMWLAIPVEGTRARTDHWKSGFYHLAVAGHLPVGLACIDYATRTVGIDAYVMLSGDEEKDFSMLRDFYAGKQGHRPENASEIRLRS